MGWLFVLDERRQELEELEVETMLCLSQRTRARWWSAQVLAGQFEVVRRGMRGSVRTS